MSNCSATPSGLARKRLAGDEQLIAVDGQVRPDHRLGGAVLGRDVEVVDPVVEGELQPRSGLLDGGGPTGRAAEDGDAALVTRPSEAPAFHRPSPG